jgi:hypothetical protein
MIELTLFAKSGGPLTKRISLTADGKLKSDGSACVMVQGNARRVRLSSMSEFATLIERLQPNEAIANGALQADIGDPVAVTTKNKLNGAAGVIARTTNYIGYRQGEPAAALFDFDSKGMPDDVRTRIRRLVSYWDALVTVLPELKGIARLTRRSTSAGLSRADTGETLVGSDGVHIYIRVKDGSDVERFLKTLHDRCWLAGLGWMMVGAGGQLLDRSIVDRMVGGPERLVFEGPPVLVPPLQQDRESRRPVAIEGDELDTMAACPPLDGGELAELNARKAKAARALEGTAAREREAFVTRRAKQLVTMRGISQAAAERIVTQQCNGILLPDVILPFDDQDLVDTSVADVLADPNKFEGETLADPLEGTSYGVGKAKIMRRADGSMWIHSFAHGRTTYELRYDAKTVRAALERADRADVVGLFIKLVMAAELEADEIEALRNFTAEKSGATRTAVKERLKAAQKAQAQAAALAARRARLAARTDPRPQVMAPGEIDPVRPVMITINRILGRSTATEPPMRSNDGTMTKVRKIPIPKMHAFGRRAEDGSPLPPPDQWVLYRLDEKEVAELLEEYIDYVDGDGESVRLLTFYVRHFVQRHDHRLPTVDAVTTLPIVLEDGTLLAPDGLDRDRGVVFKIDPGLRAILPRREDCTEEAVREATKYLCDEWLCDVATDLTGKAALIAADLTMIERTLLANRPAFWVTAGQRGIGKTITLAMLIAAILGDWPAASAWSTDENERRKSLLGYLRYGVAYILWDNIGRGEQISCPHIERSCTSTTYSDRLLGASEIVTAPATTIHFFTGNNIGPKGDLASRSIEIRLAVDRADPENRPYKHPDPIAWTQANRNEILRSLYTILLGNPLFSWPAGTIEPETRFKDWWRLVGCAVEHAMTTIGQPLKFKDVFLNQEADEEDSTSLADALAVMRQLLVKMVTPQRTEWVKNVEFKATDVADLINDARDASQPPDVIRDGTLLREFLYPAVPAASLVASARSVGKRLKLHLDHAVRRATQNGVETLTLKSRKRRDDITIFYVAVQ